MRLIDADALVKAFNEVQVEFDEYYKGLGKAKVITDNAPTVEPFEKIGAICNENCGYKPQPQGEWIDYNNTFYKCPDCGYLLEKCCPQCQTKVILPKGDADIRKPNCVTCDHFGDCEGCEKGEEE